jgi:hypothetical protein
MVAQLLVYGFYLLVIGYQPNRFIRMDIKGAVQSLFEEETNFCFMIISA